MQGGSKWVEREEKVTHADTHAKADRRLMYMQSNLSTFFYFAYSVPEQMREK